MTQHWGGEIICEKPRTRSISEGSWGGGIDRSYFRLGGIKFAGRTQKIKKRCKTPPQPGCDLYKMRTRWCGCMMPGHCSGLNGIERGRAPRGNYNSKDVAGTPDALPGCAHAASQIHTDQRNHIKHIYTLVYVVGSTTLCSTQMVAFKRKKIYIYEEYIYTHANIPSQTWRKLFFNVLAQKRPDVNLPTVLCLVGATDTSQTYPAKIKPHTLQWGTVSFLFSTKSSKDPLSKRRSIR